MVLMALLLADVDWLRLVFPIVMFLVFLLWQLLEGAKQKGQPPNRDQRRPPPANRPAQAAPQPQERPQRGGAQGQLNAEIEEFLRRASERQRDKPRPQEATAVPAPQRSKKPARRLVERPVQPEIIEEVANDRVSAHVEKHLTNREFANRAEHLTDDISRSDADMQQHFKQVFDHKVGRLADTTSSGRKAPAGDLTSAGGVAQMTDTAPVVSDMSAATIGGGLALLISDRQTLRQAILLNEILQRPTHRWDEGPEQS